MLGDPVDVQLDHVTRSATGATYVVQTGDTLYRIASISKLVTTMGALRLVGLAGDVGSGLVQLLFVLAVSLMIAAQPRAYRDEVLPPSVPARVSVEAAEGMTPSLQRGR